MDYDLTPEEIKKVRLQALKKPNTILLYKDTDGNWRGLMNKEGKVVQARQSDPGIVMQMLITHAG